ncbi:hypothetical protein GON01_02500 [Sphingomonas sp. MAH-20]|uniref:Uncharacterized protein n=1 Tax=Sphingomonas horti TaxID=2682842 RepID=A0A6I4IX95_9SPHN|nr:ShlB/FhaC/HecB family hemolysin secretion/activation protein [Sphingomonas sp. CGMCC 1.13658]MBA2920560.1 ShlB/FhaC/HecB family hemolysin secretion/activation protein [Sphingomonas sp. CGMCC 1.13658]MVO76812.1 hypothetical protein [Sphingomonas horti]
MDARGALQQVPCALEDSPVRVTLTTVTFQRPDGSPVAPELQSLLSQVGTGPGGEQPISVVCRIRDRANQLLSDAGYVALAQIPAQQISSGDLRITIVTAKIVEVRIIGDLGPFRDAIESRIAAIRRLDPLNRYDAERILLLTGDIPGVDVRLALSAAGTAPGEVIGSLTVETRRAQVLFNIQNFGSRQLGPTVASVRAEAYGVTGLADRSFFAYSNSLDWDEIRVAQGGHDFALNDSGLRAGVRASIAFSRPDIPNLDLRSRSAIVGVELSQSLVRTVQEQLGATAGLEILDQRTKLFSGGRGSPLTRDRLRVLFARIDGQVTVPSQRGDVLASMAGYAELRKGIDILSATDRGVTRNGFAPSRAEGNPQATIFRAELVGEWRPHPLFTLGAQAFGQWANDPVLNLEEFSLGNFTYGRGYDPGANGGDRAFAFRIEPRIRLPVDAPVSFELTGFYDWVRLDNLDSTSSEKNRLLRSIGGGIRILKAGRFVVDAIYAHPLDKALTSDERKPRNRFLISFTTQLYPWGRR